MDNETREALEKSIDYWIDISNHKETDSGIERDPLCVKFIEYGCDGCPVSDDGFKGCLSHDNPAQSNQTQSNYEIWERLSTESNGDRFAETQEAAKAARDMAKFLESLLQEK